MPKQIEQHQLAKTNRAAVAAKHRGEDKKQSGDDRAAAAAMQEADRQVLSVSL